MVSAAITADCFWSAGYLATARSMARSADSLSTTLSPSLTRSLVRSFTTEKQSAASWLLGIAYSPDGRLLAATDWAGTVTVWNASTGERVQTLADYKAGVLTAAFSPDSKTLATGSEDKTLRLWNVPQLTPPKE